MTLNEYLGGEFRASLSRAQEIDHALLRISHALARARANDRWEPEWPDDKPSGSISFSTQAMCIVAAAALDPALSASQKSSLNWNPS